MIKEIEDIKIIENLLKEFKQNVGSGYNPFIKYIIYEENNEILGCLVYEHIYDRIEIDYIAVDSKHRRKGIADKLIEYIINLGDFSLSLEVNIKNNIAINLYKKHGFEIVAKRNRYYGENDGYLMVRR